MTSGEAVEPAFPRQRVRVNKRTGTSGLHVCLLEPEAIRAPWGGGPFRPHKRGSAPRVGDSFGPVLPDPALGFVEAEASQCSTKAKNAGR